MARWHIRATVLPDEQPELWVEDGRIVPGPLTDAVTVDGGFVVPGLVDAHCHLGLGSGGAVDRETTIVQAITDRDSGVLLVRDAGAPTDTHWLDERHDLPRVIRAGRHIARFKRYIRNFAVEVEPDELVAEVARQAQAGDGWVKLVGDWIDREVGDLRPLWPADIARRAIDAAHEHGARVTAHCFAEQSVAELVEAGIDCIEHGTGMSDDVIQTMADRQIALVPTMTNLETFPAISQSGEDKFPTYAAHMRDLHARRFETLGKAYEAGVPIYAGTDAGGTLGHGRIAEEAALLAQLGGADFALGACSWRARSWLGAEALNVGDSADLVIFDLDPRTHIEVLAKPAMVMLRGTAVVS